MNAGGVLWMMRDGVYANYAYLYYFNRFIVALGLMTYSSEYDLSWAFGA